MATRRSITVKRTEREKTPAASLNIEGKSSHLCELCYPVLSSISDAAFVVGQDGKIIYANPSAAKIFGWDKEEFVGKNLHKIVLHSKDGKASDQCKECPMHLALNRGIIRQKGDRVFWKKDGSVLPVEYIGIPIFEDEEIVGAVIICEDVGERKRAREELMSTHARMVAEQLALRQKNIALKEILNQIENEKRSIERRIQTNIDKNAIPILETLQNRIAPSQIEYVTLLKNILKDIASPFVDKLDSNYAKLAPRELEICNLVRHGLSSKEIAEMLNISVQTVHLRRKHIRKKLNIDNRKINLSSYLQTI